MDEPYIKECAEGLDPGQSSYFPHPGCTNSFKLWVLRREDGSIYAKCMKCKETANIRGDRPDWESALDSLTGHKEAVELSPTTLPDGLNPLQEAPDAAQLWVLKAGVNLDEASRHNIQWWPDQRRVVVPCYGYANELVYWQARNVGLCGGPKYMNPVVAKDSLHIYFGQRTFTGMLTMYRATDTDPEKVVITEDILSAIRVSEYQTAIPALGTSPTKAHLAQTASRKAYLWLDPDQAGLDGAAEFLSALQFHDYPPTVIHSQADPKNLTRRAMRSVLEQVGAI